MYGVSTKGEIATTVTAKGNVYGKFSEILAFENVAPEIPLSGQAKLTQDIYYYKYSTYYMEEAEELTEKYAYWLREQGYTLIREEDDPIIRQDVGTNMLYELLSPSKNYTITIKTTYKNTDLHLSGEVTVMIDYTNGTMYDGYFTPSFDSSLANTSTTTTTPQVTTPSLSENEISLLRIESIKQASSSIDHLTQAVQHMSSAKQRGYGDLALADIADGFADLIESGINAREMMITIEPLLELDQKYVDMNNYLETYSSKCTSLFFEYPVMDITSSNFTSTLENLLLDIDDNSKTLKAATDIFYQ